VQHAHQKAIIHRDLVIETPGDAPDDKPTACDRLRSPGAISRPSMGRTVIETGNSSAPEYMPRAGLSIAGY
jgi:hypothetical protein